MWVQRCADQALRTLCAYVSDLSPRSPSALHLNSTSPAPRLTHVSPALYMRSSDPRIAKNLMEAHVSRDRTGNWICFLELVE